MKRKPRKDETGRLNLERQCHKLERAGSREVKSQPAVSQVGAAVRLRSDGKLSLIHI